jgi:hypothetical protein
MSNNLYKLINKFNNYDWSDLEPIKEYLSNPTGAASSACLEAQPIRK